MTIAEACIDRWKEQYANGYWTIEEFEAHLTAMLPVMPPSWWSEESRRPEAAIAAMRQIANYMRGFVGAA